MNKAIKSPADRVNTYFEEKIERSDAAGLQYIFTQKGQTVYSYNGGFSDLATKSRVTPSTTFMVYSTVKVVTAIAVLQLHEKGRINIDAPLVDYVSGLPYPRTLTVRHALTHTGGLPNPLPLDWVWTEKDYETSAAEKAMQKIIHDNSELDFEPGSEYAYSNIGYYLLGRLVEVVSGLPYGEYVNRYIFKPARISPEEFSFTLPRNNQATGYIKKYSLLNMVLYLMSDSRLYGRATAGYSSFNRLYNIAPSTGGGYATARAWQKLLNALIFPSDSRLLKTETIELMFSPQRLNDGSFSNSACGFTLGKNGQYRYLFKPGGGAGFHSAVRIYPELQAASILQSSMTDVSATSISEEADRLDRQFIENFNRRKQP